MPSPPLKSRRLFLAQVGAVGVALGAGGLGVPAAAARRVPSVRDLTADRSLLAGLARDAVSGLVVFVVPGPDPFSRAQGTTVREPGAYEAGTSDFMVGTLDNLVPFAPAIAEPVASGFKAALSDPASDSEKLLGLPAWLANDVDDALGELLASPRGVPLSLAVALLLGLLALSVDPAVVHGPFLAPFSRLSFDAKATVFGLLEGPEADLAGALDPGLPESLRGLVVGVLPNFAAALLELPALATYSEQQVFDPATRTITATPIGWTLTGYDGVSEGWDELVGYYQGRTEVED